MPENKKQRAVIGFMVTKREERLVNQGMLAARPKKTAVETNMGGEAGRGRKDAKAGVKRECT
jgi:hypothetical protein